MATKRNGKGREGGNLLNQTLKHPPVSTTIINNLSYDVKNVNGKLQERVKEYIQEGIQNGFNIILFYVSDGELTKIPNWMEAGEAFNYQAKLDDLLRELDKKPYGYGVLVGKQLGDFYFVCIDIDIDTEDCKERISRELEELLSKYEIKSQKEITKSGRIHYYIILDRITDKIERVSKLHCPENCRKFKDGKETKGDIELFTKNKAVVVYNGIINNEKPFFTKKPVINNYQAFEAFLDEYLSKFESKEPTKEQVKEQAKETKKLFSKIVEAYKIIRKYRIVNGWEIDKVFSAYCIRENITTEKAIEGFKTIYGLEYDEKTTLRILQLTKKKDLNLLPSLGSVYYHINTALNSGAELEDFEKEVLKAVLNELRSDYSDYELPEYLKNAEDIILDYSTKKDGKEYYKEGYFIVKNVNGIKKVIYVKIKTSEKGGIYKHHTLDGDIKEVGIKAEIVRLVQDDKMTVYEFLLNDELSYKPSFNYSKTDDIINEITLKTISYTMLYETALYKRYLTRLIEKYREEHGKPIPCIISRQTGWSEDLRFFYHYGLDDAYHELSKEHILYKKGKAIIKDKDNQHEVVKEILREGKLLGVLLVASVSSLFIKPFGIPGITVIISGNSGAGKTTSSLIATSLFYYSDDVLINAKATEAGSELTISSFNSLPVLIDEGALAGDKKNLSLNDLVFMVNSGTGKTRGRKDLSVDFKELKSNVFWTTEKTEIDELRRTGAFRRMLNIVVKSWNDLTELFKLEERINEKYSGCGIDYIQYLIEHMEEIKKAFKEETKDFSSKYKEITPVALNLYSGLILLEKFYNTRFDRLRETINKVLNDAKGLFLENKENVVQILKDFLISNTTLRFHIINTDEVKDKLSNQDIWGEYDAKTQTYYILASSFKKIAKEIGKERNLLVEELTKAKVLKDKNVSYWMKSIKQAAKVYIVSFGADKEEAKTDSNVINNTIVDDEVEF